ncbi:MAG: hypothetical protein RH942_17135 [Kiloniellaceae bacterium]
MAVTLHSIARHTVQVLTKKLGEEAHSFITVRLYDHDDVIRGTAVFEHYGEAQEPPKPTGDYKAQTAVAHIDIAHYPAYMDVLRLENPIYLKMGWTQSGRVRVLSQMSIDTKKEVIGEYFG